MPLDVTGEMGQGSGHRGVHAPVPTRFLAPCGAHAPSHVLLTGARGGVGVVVVVASPYHHADQGTEREQRVHQSGGAFLRLVDPSRVPLGEPGRTTRDPCRAINS